MLLVHRVLRMHSEFRRVELYARIPDDTRPAVEDFAHKIADRGSFKEDFLCFVGWTRPGCQCC